MDLAASVAASQSMQIRRVPRAGTVAAYISIFGRGTTLPADTTVEVYTGVVRGEKGDPGTGTTIAQVEEAILLAVASLRAGVPADRDTLNELNDAIVALEGMMGGGGVDIQQVLDVILEGSNVTIDRGTDGQITLNVADGAIATGTADILIDELGTNLTTITLTTDLFWLGTGITVPASVHGVLIDLSPATDDYHFVDWDTIRGKDGGRNRGSIGLDPV